MKYDELMEYDKLILKLMYDNNTHTKYYKRLRASNKSKFTNIKSWFIKRYNDIDHTKHIEYTEVIYRLLHNISQTPKCVICNRPVKFSKDLNKGYYRHCSHSCAMKNLDVQHHIQNTSLHRYGSINNSLKISKKRKEWYMSLSKSEIAKYKNSKRESYNKYLLSMTDEERKAEYIKRFQTKKRNGTVKASSLEIECKRYLKSKNINFCDEYVSDAYPFSCDIYLTDYDVYIELQGSWTHGQHPFNKELEEDNKILEKWKSKNTKYYDNAIYTWTIRDPNKRKIVKENNLRYYEVWNYKEFIDLINMLFE